MAVTDMLEMGFRSHEITEIQFIEFEEKNWAIRVRFNKSQLCSLVTVHTTTARTYTNLGRAVNSMKKKLKKGNSDFNNYRLIVYKDP